MSYTLLIDETGTGGTSKKVIFVGCLVKTDILPEIEQKIAQFNQDMLNMPGYSGKRGLVNNLQEARHFVYDHFTLRELFVMKVLVGVDCRIYASMATYAGATLQEDKKRLMEDLIAKVTATRRIDGLEIVAEESDSAFQAGFPDVTFKSKQYLPLSIADYYAGMLHAFHNMRAKLQQGEPVNQQGSSFDIRFYETMLNQIAIEHDISTGEISSRDRGRIFLEQFKAMYTEAG